MPACEVQIGGVIPLRPRKRKGKGGMAELSKRHSRAAGRPFKAATGRDAPGILRRHEGNGPWRRVCAAPGACAPASRSCPP